MARGKKTDKETENKIWRMSEQGISGNQIAKKLNMHVNTVNDILRRKRKLRYATHCYTCEYSIYEDTADTRKTMPTVKGCLMRCDTPKTCRRWLDDKKTADKIKHGLKAKCEARRENEEKAIHKQERDQPCSAANDRRAESSKRNESGERGA